GADAVMIGRGAQGRPWIAAAIDRVLAGGEAAEPELETRLGIVLDHFRDSLAFYGDRLGLRVFRKHLARYVEEAPCPASSEARRQAKSQLCRLESPARVEADLTRLWLGQELREAA